MEDEEESEVVGSDFIGSDDEEITIEALELKLKNILEEKERLEKRKKKEELFAKIKEAKAALSDLHTDVQPEKNVIDNWYREDLMKFFKSKGLLVKDKSLTDLRKIAKSISEAKIPDFNHSILPQIKRRTIIHDGKTHIVPEVMDAKLTKWSQDLSSLPSLEHFVTNSYILTNTDLDLEELRQLKQEECHALFKDGAVQNLQSHRVAGCYSYVRCLCLSNRTNNTKSEEVWCLISDTGLIWSAGCSCIQDNGCCKHVIALLLTLSSTDKGNELLVSEKQSQLPNEHNFKEKKVKKINNNQRCNDATNTDHLVRHTTNTGYCHLLNHSDESDTESEKWTPPARERTPNENQNSQSVFEEKMQTNIETKHMDSSLSEFLKDKKQYISFPEKKHCVSDFGPTGILNKKADITERHNTLKENITKPAFGSSKPVDIEKSGIIDTTSALKTDDLIIPKRDNVTTHVPSLQGNDSEFKTPSNIFSSFVSEKKDGYVSGLRHVHMPSTLPEAFDSDKQYSTNPKPEETSDLLARNKISLCSATMTFTSPTFPMHEQKEANRFQQLGLPNANIPKPDIRSQLMPTPNSGLQHDVKSSKHAVFTANYGLQQRVQSPKLRVSTPPNSGLQQGGKSSIFEMPTPTPKSGFKQNVQSSISGLPAPNYGIQQSIQSSILRTALPTSNAAVKQSVQPSVCRVPAYRSNQSTQSSQFEFTASHSGSQHSVKTSEFEVPGSNSVLQPNVQSPSFGVQQSNPGFQASTNSSFSQPDNQLFEPRVQHTGVPAYTGLQQPPPNVIYRTQENANPNLYHINQGFVTFSRRMDTSKQNDTSTKIDQKYSSDEPLLNPCDPVSARARDRPKGEAKGAILTETSYVNIKQTEKRSVASNLVRTEEPMDFAISSNNLPTGNAKTKVDRTSRFRPISTPREGHMPSNKSGRITYDREFLLKLRQSAFSKCLPDISHDPDIPVVMEESDIHVPKSNFNEVSGYARSKPEVQRPRSKSRQPGKKSNLKCKPDDTTIAEVLPQPTRTISESSLVLSADDVMRTAIGALNMLRNGIDRTKVVTLISELPIDTEDVLNRMVTLIVDTAIDEPRLIPDCSSICREISIVKVPSRGRNGMTTFSSAFRQKCEKEIELGILSHSQSSYQRRVEELIRFTIVVSRCSLFDIVDMHHILLKLCSAGSACCLECFCNLLSDVFDKIVRCKSENFFDQYAEKIDENMDNADITSSLQSKLAQLLTKCRQNEL